MLNAGELPLGRAFPVTPTRPADPRDDPAAEDRAISTWRYFRDKFGVDILDEFGDGFDELAGAKAG